MIARAQEEIEPLEVAGKPSDLWFGVRSMTASIAFHSDQLDAAIAVARDTHARARQHNNRTVGTGSASMLAHAHFVRSEYAEAARWAETSLELAREIGNVSMGRQAAAVAIAAAGRARPAGRPPDAICGTSRAASPAPPTWRCTCTSSSTRCSRSAS